MAPCTLLFAGFFQGTPVKAGPLANIVRELPPLTRVETIRRETWKLERLPYKLPDKDYTELAVQVDGRTVKLGPTADYEYLSLEGKGSDGSLLVYRWSQGEMAYSSVSTIWYRGKETTVSHGGVTFYRDRLNYAGSYVSDYDPMGPRLVSPESYIFENGKVRQLGWGAMRHWGPDGLGVLEVPVNAEGVPSGQEETSEQVTRIVGPGVDTAVCGYRFVGRAKDGSVYLSTGVTGDGLVYQQPRETPRRLLRWRAGRFTDHWELPVGWKVEGMAPDGWVLLRPMVQAPPAPPYDPVGKKAEDVFRHAIADEMDEYDSDLLSERNWDAGIFRNGVLTVVRLPKPKGTEKMLWRGEASVYGLEAFRFHTFYGNDDRLYRASRP